MKYDIYFHGGCFDGVASAAMLKYFLNSRGDEFANYIPMTHPVDRKKWKTLKPKNPMAITDIFYHPKSTIYFDHHPTTFMNKKWEKNFRKDKFHILNTKSPSCAGLIYRHLAKDFHFKWPKYLKKLVYWTDLTDRAQFKSAKEAIGINPSSAIKLAIFLDNKKLPLSYQKKIINSLGSNRLSFVVQDIKIKNWFVIYEKKLKKSLMEIKKHLTLFGDVVVLENAGKRLVGTRFSGFYFYPKSKYVIRFLKRSNYVLSIGINPWNKPKNQASIGKYLGKNYGGGGHAYAGSAPFKTKKQALEAKEIIVKYLNKHV